MLFDERLDRTAAPGGVLIGGNQPVVGTRRFQPLGDRPARTAVIGRRMIVHELLEKVTGASVPYRQWQRFPAHALTPRLFMLGKASVLGREPPSLSGEQQDADDDQR